VQTLFLPLPKLIQSKIGKACHPIHQDPTSHESVINDSLPYHPTDHTLLCISVVPTIGGQREDTGQIVWPSLIEKAVSWFDFRILRTLLKQLSVYETHGRVRISRLVCHTFFNDPRNR